MYTFLKGMHFYFPIFLSGGYMSGGICPDTSPNHDISSTEHV